MCDDEERLIWKIDSFRASGREQVSVSRVIVFMLVSSIFHLLAARDEDKKQMNIKTGFSTVVCTKTKQFPKTEITTQYPVCKFP